MYYFYIVGRFLDFFTAGGFSLIENTIRLCSFTSPPVDMKDGTLLALARVMPLGRYTCLSIDRKIILFLTKDSSVSHR